MGLATKSRTKFTELLTPLRHTEFTELDSDFDGSEVAAVMSGSRSPDQVSIV